MDRLRVLHVLDHSAPLHSGYAFRTLSILAKQRALGWDTFHLTTPKQGKTAALEEQVDGTLFHRTPFVEGQGLLGQMNATRARLETLVRELRPDVLHPHSPVLNALPALWVGRAHGLPVVYEMRASWEDAAVDHGTTTEGSLRYRGSRALESFALRRADRVTTICEGLRGDIVSRGVPAQHVTVVPNAVDVDAFEFDAPCDEALRQQLGLVGCTVIGFAGSFYGYEGLGLLLQAFARLLPQRPELRLLLVGGGLQEEALRAQAMQLGVGGQVCFTGRVPHAQVHAYYRLIDILAYPRLPMRLTELVTPLKPLEAMAEGRVLIASDVGGHRELVRHGETGFLFKADDVQALVECVEAVLGCRAEWPRIRAQARRFVETQRNWTRSVSAYREVYRQALAAKGRRHASLED